MPELIWDQSGNHIYETGVKQGVLYPRISNVRYSTGIAWNGLVSVTENTSGAEATAIYADDIKYLSLLSAEEMGITIEAYSCPDGFAPCNGFAEIATGVMAGQQPRKAFGMCYKTIVGNDIKNNENGYKLHLIYGAMAAPTEKGYATINDSPEAITFSWEVTTTPISVNGRKPSASVVIDSTKISDYRLKVLEDCLYGTGETNPTLPSISELIRLLSNSLFDSQSNYILDSDGNEILNS